MISYEKENNLYNWLILALFGSTLLFTSLFRGLFFEKEAYVFSTIFSLISLAFMILSSIKMKEFVFKSFAHFWGAGVVAAYWIMVFFAVDQPKAIFEAIKMSMYFMVFLTISQTVKGKYQINFINYIFILSGIVVAVIGFGAAFGSFSYKDAYLDGRITSTFQYYNTFGAYMLGVIFLTAGQIAQSDRIKKNILNIPGYLTFMGLIFSYSRGAWVLLPIVGFIMLLLLNEKGIKRVIVSFLSIGISIATSISFIYKAINASNASIGWLWLGLGCMLSFLIGLICDLVLKRFCRVQLKKKQIVFFLAGIAIFLIIGLSSGILGKFLPDTFEQRIQGVNFKTFTVVERNVFYKDAFKIIKENPIIGVGGGGWQVLYPAYKSYNYSSTQVHNYFIQTWIEVGLIGLLLVLGFYISNLWRGYKVLKTSDENAHSSIVGMLVAVLALVVHSMIDFDMALGAYGLFIWALLGAVAAVDKENKKEFSGMSHKIANVVLVLFVLFVGFIGTSFSYANKQALEGMKAAQENNFEQVEDYFVKAVQYNSFMPSYRLDLGNLQFQKGQQMNSQDEMKMGLDNINLALSMNDRDIGMLTNGIMFHLRRGKIEEGIELLEKMQTYYPLENKTYNDSIKVYYNVAITLLKNQNNTEAKQYFEKVLKMNETVIQKNQELQKLQQNLLKDVHDAPPEYLEKAFKLQLQPDSLQIVKDSEQLVKALNK